MMAVAALPAARRQPEQTGGAAELSDCYALGRILAGVGKTPAQAMHLSQTLLSRAGSLVAVIQSAPARLRCIGASDQEIEAIKAVECALDATLVRRLDERPILSNSQAVVDYLHTRMSFRHREQLECLFFNGILRFIHIETISTGTFNLVDVNIRDIVKMAIELNSAGIIVCHNHPSGSLEPSRPDIQSTLSLKMVCENLRIQLFDHLIVSPAGHYSMRSAGLLDR